MLTNHLNKIGFLSIMGMAVASSWTSSLGSPVIPAGNQKQPIAIVNATIHPITRGSMQNATIVFEKGKITQIGEDVQVPGNAKVIDASHKHVYPAMFNAGGQLGLVEINSVRATKDYSETGSLNPNVRAETAVNPDSEIIPVTRSNGVLAALSVPTGGLIAGQSAVLQLDGWSWEDLTLKRAAGMHINWPRLNLSEDNSRMTGLKKLTDFVDQAKMYHQAKTAKSHQRIDVRLESMMGVLDKKTPFVVHANSLAQIKSAVAFCDQHNLRLIIYGGYDAEKCAELLKEKNVPVIISSIYRLPAKRSDFFDDSYTLPNRLLKKGVPFCIAGVGRFGASNLRNLPYHAATAVAYGLPEDEAMKAITIYPAQILGVDDQIGSLEIAKDATLIVSTGTPLETATKVELAFVQGKPLDLSNRQIGLWKKYQEKYHQKNLLP